ncbi:ubiquitin thioesterase otubain-like [Pollicipes pollicipes]|uniref:ubiquitin thioesterase otubain-like n=1 Tax=Pollicipes pollicipes TaxID=41117 RepID=UPI001884F2B2|nr:ubiquitin thioesterase otubain-like [Pollicipes pollicipes]
MSEETAMKPAQAEVNQDDLVMAQQRNIEQEIAANTALVGAVEEVTCLLEEYASDAVYQQKIKHLNTKYHSLRRTRPDGNCFFRAFAFSYFESLIGDQQEFERFYKIAKDSKDDLIALGFPKFTLEDFHDMFIEVLDRVKSAQSADDIEQILQEPAYSDYVVVYMRLVTSGHMQKNADFYVNFLDGYPSVKDFCALEVEPMYKESDHIHITCLTSAVGVGVRVEYMDRGGNEVNAHDFCPEGVDEPRIRLLYRPGHYDILYL